MNTQIKVESADLEHSGKTVSCKKEKIGRWSTAECYLFESLLQRFGKNWKKIQEHMKNRSLGQIRSHAQKYFDKIGTKKVEEFERRAKLLEAYDILQKEKRLREQTKNQNASDQNKPNAEIKQQEESPLTAEQNVTENHFSKQLESINLKPQQNGISENVRMETPQTNQAQVVYPFLNGFNPFNAGYLIQILGQNPQPFYRFNGIQPYIDSPAFRASIFHRQ